MSEASFFVEAPAEGGTQPPRLRLADAPPAARRAGRGSCSSPPACSQRSSRRGSRRTPLHEQVGPVVRPSVVAAPARPRRRRHRHGHAPDLGYARLARRRLRGDLRLDGDRRHRRCRRRLLRRPHRHRADADHRLLPRHPGRPADDRRRRDLGAEPLPHHHRDRDPALDEHGARDPRAGEERARARLREAGAGARGGPRADRAAARAAAGRAAPDREHRPDHRRRDLRRDRAGVPRARATRARSRSASIIEHAFERAAISTGAWWAIVPPGVLVALLILACSLIGGALEDALNPRLRVAHLSARTFRLRPLVGRGKDAL